MNLLRNSNINSSPGSPELTNITVFILLLSSGALLSLILPKPTISEIEKRELTPFPLFSWEQLFEGTYTDSLDLYYADNFPFREPFVDMSGLLNQSFGYRANDVRFYTTQSGPTEGQYDGPAPGMDSLTTKAKDSVTVKPVPIDTIKNKQANFSSILIYKSRAFQWFTGSSEYAKQYADMINSYRRAVADSLRIFCLVAPTPIDFYLPMANKTPRNIEKTNIDIVHANLDSGVIAVDAYGEIEAHADQYLYFNTDHHWTGRGAYYAYKAFCASSGIEPYQLSALNRKIWKRKYLGSLYDMTKDIRLRDNADSVESFRLPVSTITYRYKTPNLEAPELSPLFVETNRYTTFLGGDYPLVKIESDIPGDKRVLVIKDSYGNAMAPYLALHFREVFVVDYRYFEKNLLNFIKRNKITDIIFLHNTFVVNTKYTVKKELYLMIVRERVLEPVHEDTVRKKEELNTDSTQNRTKNNNE